MSVGRAPSPACLQLRQTRVFLSVTDEHFDGGFRGLKGQVAVAGRFRGRGHPRHIFMSTFVGSTFVGMGFPGLGLFS